MVGSIRKVSIFTLLYSTLKIYTGRSPLVPSNSTEASRQLLKVICSMRLSPSPVFSVLVRTIESCTLPRATDSTSRGSVRPPTNPVNCIEPKLGGPDAGSPVGELIVTSVSTLKE